MKYLKASFLAVVALIAMSFTLVSNQDFLDDTPLVSNCYQTVAFEYEACPDWLTLPTNCTAAQAADGKYVRSTGFSATNHTFSPIDCAGGNVICCVKFEAVTTPPCIDDVKEGDVNGSGQIVAGTKKIKVLDIFCKP